MSIGPFAQATYSASAPAQPEKKIRLTLDAWRIEFGTPPAELIRLTCNGIAHLLKTNSPRTGSSALPWWLARPIRTPSSRPVLLSAVTWVRAER